MNLRMAGRTAVVCASTSGLGEAVACALAAEGSHVVVSGRWGERARHIAGRGRSSRR
jgi:3-oxoacyl-[acyl-carrier protein] reductase